MNQLLPRIAPALFVLLWSTGFIASKLGGPYAEPATFLSVRFLIVLAILVPVALLFSAPWPTGWPAIHSIVVGALIHGAYLGGVFWAIRNGLPAGVSALIVSLQPVLTAVLAATLLGERITPRHWGGLALGLLGAALVVGPKIELAEHARSTGITVATVCSCGVALLGMTIGTIYQKRFSTKADLRTGTALQFIGALVVTAPLALVVETREIVWSAPFMAALAWLVIVLSIVSIMLLMFLIRQNAVSRLSGLFYLVPAVTAGLAFLMFGETLTLVQLTGVAMVMGAVVLIDPVGTK